MAHFYGKGSGYLKGNTIKYSVYAVCIFLVTEIILTIATFFNFKHRGENWLTYPVLIGVGIIFVVFKKYFNQAAKGSFSFLNGYKGEGAIAKELKKLPDDYYVYQDVSVPGSPGNIDFVVSGPTGIFTIEVKSHHGVIDFNGRELIIDSHPFEEKDVFRQAIDEATNLHDYLEQKTGEYIFINPVMVFSNPRALMHFGMNKVGDRLLVIQKKWLLDLLTSSKGQITNKMTLTNQALESLVQAKTGI